MLVSHSVLTRMLSLMVFVGAVELLTPTPSEATLSCGQTIGPNETVVLTHDLSCLTTNFALTVVGPAVLDLGGHTIECQAVITDNTVIRVQGEGAIVRQGTVTGCQTGIRIEGPGGRHVIKDVTAMGVLIGFDVRISHGNTFLKNTAKANVVGFAGLGPANDNVWDGNTAENSGGAFQVFGDGNVFKNNKATNYTGTGYLVGGKGNALSRNRALGGGVGQFGFRIGDGNGNVVRQNLAKEHSIEGFEMFNGSGFLVTGNTAKYNVDGIRLFNNVRNSVVFGNTALNNDNLDLRDGNVNCDKNVWVFNRFRTSDPVNCIR